MIQRRAASGRGVGGFPPVERIRKNSPPLCTTSLTPPAQECDALSVPRCSTVSCIGSQGKRWASPRIVQLRKPLAWTTDPAIHAVQALRTVLNRAVWRTAVGIGQAPVVARQPSAAGSAPSFVPAAPKWSNWGFAQGRQCPVGLSIPRLSCAGCCTPATILAEPFTLRRARFSPKGSSGSVLGTDRDPRAPAPAVPRSVLRQPGLLHLPAIQRLHRSAQQGVVPTQRPRSCSLRPANGPPMANHCSVILV